MINNIDYLRTAVEVLAQGDQTPMTEAKILRVISQICEMNIARIETDLVDSVDELLYNTNTEKRSEHA